MHVHIPALVLVGTLFPGFRVVDVCWCTCTSSGWYYFSRLSKHNYEHSFGVFIYLWFVLLIFAAVRTLMSYSSFIKIYMHGLHNNQ